MLFFPQVIAHFNISFPSIHSQALYVDIKPNDALIVVGGLHTTFYTLISVVG